MVAFPPSKGLLLPTEVVSLESGTFGVSELRHESIPPYKRRTESLGQASTAILSAGVLALVMTPRGLKAGFKPE